MPEDDTITRDEWLVLVTEQAALGATRAERRAAAATAHWRYSLAQSGKPRLAREGQYLDSLEEREHEVRQDLIRERDAPVDTQIPNRTLASSREQRTCAQCGAPMAEPTGSGRPSKTCSEACRKARRAKAAMQDRAGHSRHVDETREEDSWGKPLPMASIPRMEGSTKFRRAIAADITTANLHGEDGTLHKRGPLVHLDVPGAYKGPSEGETTSRYLRVLGALDRQVDGSPLGERWERGERI